MTNDETQFDRSALEGPEIDRRTAMRLMGAAGISSSFAGCTGGGGGGGGENDSSGGGSSDTDETEMEGSAKMGGTVKMGMLTDNLDSLDPHLVDKGAQMEIQSNVFNGLLKLSQEKKIVGDAAKDWEIPDNTTYVFTLHENMTFHNGDPLDAEAVKWSLERLQEFEKSEHRGKVSTVESIEATGEYEVTINMSQTTAPFLAFMTNVPGRAGAIVHKSAAEDPEGYNKEPLGSGPFKVESHQAGESITLVKHDGYHETDDEGNQLPYVDTVEANLIPEPSTMWSAVSSESIHHADQMTGSFAQQGESKSNLSVEATSPGNWFVLAPLGADPQEHAEEAKLASGYDEVTTKWEGKDIPTANKKVRHAMAMAIDREELVKKGFFGYATAAHSLINPVIGDYYEEKPEPGQYYDPEKAKQLLDEAGYTGDPRFSFSLLATPEQKRWVTVIQQQLANVGIQANLDLQQPSSYWDQIYRYNHMVTTYSGSTDIDPYMSWWKQLGTPDAETSLGVWQKSMMFDEEFDAALKKSFSTPKVEDRKKYVQQAEEVFLDLAMYTMLVFPLKTKITVKALKDVGIQAGMSNMHRAYLAE
ncbi:ABC transporter substrate-binding protein [Halolamina sp.]|uniref:ABC transporter substrate-binding protein n=1 Tax=Halolamina sp. TaxID=1940283 RepID=UPI00356905EB